MTNDVPIIETPRLRLRGWRDADLEPWVAMCADTRVMATLGPVRDRATALADATRLSSRLAEKGYGWWVLEVKDGLPFAGLISIQEVPFEASFTPATEVGWRLAHDAWGHGYATEAGRAAVDFAFEKLGRERLIAITAAINLRSQRVMERIGMVRDPAGDFAHPYLPVESPLHASVLYRIERPRAFS